MTKPRLAPVPSAPAPERPQTQRQKSIALARAIRAQDTAEAAAAKARACALRNRWPIGVGNALALTARDLEGAECFISNLPWERSWLHPLIWHLAAIAPLWSLHDASWAYTQQAARFGPVCTDVVAVGRLKWFADRLKPIRHSDESDDTFADRQKRTKNHDPPDDCAWYRFDCRSPAPTRFHFPVERGEAARAGQMALI